MTLGNLSTGSVFAARSLPCLLRQTPCLLRECPCLLRVVVAGGHAALVLQHTTRRANMHLILLKYVAMALLLLVHA